MIPAVFYGRFSHEDLTDKSIEDQRPPAIFMPNASVPSSDTNIPTTR